nr:MAG TPA: hypothetical protein [Caudoviricetes sp.]
MGLTPISVFKLEQWNTYCIPESAMLGMGNLAFPKKIECDTFHLECILPTPRGFCALVVVFEETTNFIEVC